MTEDPATRDLGGGAEWLLTPEEIRSLRSTRRHFLLGLIVATALTLGAVGLTAWSTTRHPHHPLEMAAPVLGLVPAAAAAIWFAGRARIVGQDIRTGRAEMQWGRVTRLWRRLRVVEVEGLLFPLQVTPVPTVRPGERVRLRFAPRSRITLGIQTLREVVAAERLAGRPPCPGVLAELGGDFQ